MGYDVNSVGGIYFIFGDDQGDLFRLMRGRIENLSAGGGNDRIIATENHPGIREPIGIFSKPNPLYYVGDVVHAGSGDDAIIIEASGGLFLGGDGDDAISNDGPGGNVMRIYGDDDSFTDTAGHGNDTISDGVGNEYIDGGEGTDLLLFDNVDDAVTVVLGDANPNGTYELGSTSGGSGNDVLLRIENVGGSRFGDVITGNNVANVISGGNGPDTVSGQEGDDLIFGNAGNDTIRGDDGEDEIHGDGGSDTLRGGNDDDDIFGGPGGDTLLGDQGNDYLNPGSGTNTVRGGIGIDTVDYSDAPVAIFADLDPPGPAGGVVRRDLGSGAMEFDFLSSVENLIGTAFNDFIAGSSAANNLQGRGGDDAIAGGGSGDLIAGGAGEDFLFGNDGGDAISGGNQADFIDGGTGNDTIYGGRGADVILGGPDSDTLSGDAGDDLYVWGPADLSRTARDTVSGFSPGDTLVFNNLVPDPATAQASDWLRAVVQPNGEDTLLIFDTDGTPGPGTGVDAGRDVALLLDVVIPNSQALALLQLAGGIDFTATDFG